MNKHIGPVALSAAILGLVGGGALAASVAFQPVEKPVQRQVQLVEPAAEVVPVPTVTTTTAAPKPVATATVAPAPVKSVVKAKAPAPAPVQRQAVVSEPAPQADPEPTPDPQVSILQPNPKKPGDPSTPDPK